MSEPRVVLRVGNQQYGLPAMLVQEMLALPPLTRVPNQGAHARGVMNLRGRVVPVRDLRTMVGHETLAQEIASFALEQRERDHIEWVDALEHSVTTGERFEKARSPYDCAFGKWYYGFHTDNAMLAAVLSRFEEPHRQLHEAANVACELVHGGRPAEALALVEQVRGRELAQLRQLFALTRDTLAEAMREVAVVVNHRDGLIAFTVDAVEAVEALHDVPADECHHDHRMPHLVAAFQRRPSHDSLVMLLDSNPDGALFAA